jgi:hypothetical protein
MIPLLYPATFPHAQSTYISITTFFYSTTLGFFVVV